MSSRVKKAKGGKRKRLEHPSLTKQERILLAAISVLAERGFHRTTVHDIAQAAGVADGTIYLYFKNKDQLLIELFKDLIARALRAFREELRMHQGAEAKLRAFIKTHLRLVEEEAEIAQIIAVELRQSSMFIRDYRNRGFMDYLRLIEGILEEGITEGLFRPSLPVAVIARSLFGALDELALAWLLAERKKSPLREMAEHLADIWLGGVRNTLDRRPSSP
ncbi:MAG: TetR/AcrR family transcriptional regulator [Myxococcota bacterium]